MVEGTVEHGAFMELLADLPAGQESMLLHVVKCESCRAGVVRSLSGRVSEEAELREKLDCLGQVLAEGLADGSYRRPTSEKSSHWPPGSRAWLRRRRRRR